MNHKRRKSKRQVRCTMCTEHRWKGNAGGLDGRKPRADRAVGDPDQHLREWGAYDPPRDPDEDIEADLRWDDVWHREKRPDWFADWLAGRGEVA